MNICVEDTPTEKHDAMQGGRRQEFNVTDKVTEFPTAVISVSFQISNFNFQFSDFSNQ